MGNKTSEKMTQLEERLFENTIMKKNVPSAEKLDEMQDKIEKQVDTKKEYAEKRKDTILQRLTIEKELLQGDCLKADKAEKYEMVNHPKHYNNYDVEVVDMMEKIWGTKATMEWCKMTAYKYRMRMGTKPGEDDTKEALQAKLMEDFNKEQWYLEKAKELKSKLFDKSIDMDN